MPGAHALRGEHAGHLPRPVVKVGVGKASLFIRDGHPLRKPLRLFKNHLGNGRRTVIVNTRPTPQRLQPRQFLGGDKAYQRTAGMGRSHHLQGALPDRPGNHGGLVGMDHATAADNSYLVGLASGINHAVKPFPHPAMRQLPPLAHHVAKAYVLRDGIALESKGDHGADTHVATKMSGGISAVADGPKELMPKVLHHCQRVVVTTGFHHDGHAFHEHPPRIFLLPVATAVIEGEKGNPALPQQLGGGQGEGGHEQVLRRGVPTTAPTVHFRLVERGHLRDFIPDAVVFHPSETNELHVAEHLAKIVFPGLVSLAAHRPSLRHGRLIHYYIVNAGCIFAALLGPRRLKVAAQHVARNGIAVGNGMVKVRKEIMVKGCGDDFKTAQGKRAVGKEGAHKVVADIMVESLLAERTARHRHLKPPVAILAHAAGAVVDEAREQHALPPHHGEHGTPQPLHIRLKGKGQHRRKVERGERRVRHPRHIDAFLRLQQRKEGALFGHHHFSAFYGVEMRLRRADLHFSAVKVRKKNDSGHNDGRKKRAEHFFMPLFRVHYS